MPTISERRIYTVSELNRSVRTLLEGHYPMIWLEGELSNLSRPASGHLYFSLKDSKAQIRCAFFRNRARLLNTPLSNGQNVVIRARLSLYEPRGDYQLIVEHLEEAGEGALRRAFEDLRRRLDQEGLFANEHKQALPSLPKRIGVITSASGAALRDVLSVLKRRFPSLPVLIYPTAVQGEDAGPGIVQAIEQAAARQDCDVLLLVRGGGSLEDLWAFNQEIVARAIHACNIPIVSGVGHEVDVTIADFVADVRAPTPSAAAELISPDREDWLNRFAQLRMRLQNNMQRQLSERYHHLSRLSQALTRQHPGRRLQDRMLRLDELEQRLQKSLALHLERQQNRLAAQHMRLMAQNPLHTLQQLDERQQNLVQRLSNSMNHALEQQRQRLAAASRALHSVSPLQTLGRGYAIVRTADSGEIIRATEQVSIGDKVEALLGDGALICQVEEKK